jgi:fucose 4-O-acetylase-like acetyltransferase
MYFVVMPRVNLIVILMTYVRYLYSINCPTVICLPSILLFILWRDTTSELWTPVHSFYIAITVYYFTRIIYILAYYYLLPFDTLNPLFTANR